MTTTMNGSPASPWPGRLAWTLAGLAIALLLFPDGRLPSRRWRFVAGCAIVGIVGTLVCGAAVQSFQDFPGRPSR